MFKLLFDRSPEAKAWKQAESFRKRVGLPRLTSKDYTRMEVVFHDCIHQVTGLGLSNEDEALVERLELMLLGYGGWSDPDLKPYISQALTSLLEFAGEETADGIKPLWTCIEPSALQRWFEMSKW